MGVIALLTDRAPPAQGFVATKAVSAPFACTVPTDLY